MEIETGFLIKKFEYRVIDAKSHNVLIKDERCFSEDYIFMDIDGSSVVNFQISSDAVKKMGGLPKGRYYQELFVFYNDGAMSRHPQEDIVIGREIIERKYV